jgi:hypothetical protein
LEAAATDVIVIVALAFAPFVLSELDAVIVTVLPVGGVDGAV